MKSKITFLLLTVIFMPGEIIIQRVNWKRNCFGLEYYITPVIRVAAGIYSVRSFLLISFLFPAPFCWILVLKCNEKLTRFLFLMLFIFKFKTKEFGITIKILKFVRSFFWVLMFSNKEWIIVGRIHIKNRHIYYRLILYTLDWH